MKIALSMFNLNGHVRVIAYQDEPQYRETGGTADLTHADFLEFHERAGSTHAAATAPLESVLQQPPRVRRHRLDVSAQQLQSLREFEPELIQGMLTG